VAINLHARVWAPPTCMTRHPRMVDGTLDQPSSLNCCRGKLGKSCQSCDPLYDGTCWSPKRRLHRGSELLLSPASAIATTFLSLATSIRQVLPQSATPSLQIETSFDGVISTVARRAKRSTIFVVSACCAVASLLSAGRRPSERLPMLPDSRPFAPLPLAPTAECQTSLQISKLCRPTDQASCKRKNPRPM
jgi:hypothetical protein